MLWWQTVWRTPGLHEHIRGVYINVRILLNTFRWEGATFPECNHRLSDPSRCVLCFAINPYSGKNFWFILALPCSCQMPDDLGPRAEVQIPEEEEEDVKGEMETLITEEVTEQWDCESILSTYSNLYNHPKLIIDPPKPSTIKVSIKTGIPLGVLPKPNLTAKQLERLEMINVGDVPRASTQIRQHGENKEEKRFRKQAIKVERKERRIEKKTNRAAFKMEKVRQEQVLLNLKQNLQGIKLWGLVMRVSCPALPSGWTEEECYDKDLQLTVNLASNRPEEGNQWHCLLW